MSYGKPNPYEIDNPRDHDITPLSSDEYHAVNLGLLFTARMQLPRWDVFYGEMPKLKRLLPILGIDFEEWYYVAFGYKQPKEPLC